MNDFTIRRNIHFYSAIFNYPKLRKNLSQKTQTLILLIQEAIANHSPFLITKNDWIYLKSDMKCQRVYYIHKQKIKELTRISKNDPELGFETIINGKSLESWVTVQALQHCAKLLVSDNQESIIEKAKAAAQLKPYETARCIQSFRIINVEALTELAFICMEKTAKTANFIQYFRITDQKVLEKLALICFNKDPEELAANFHHFNILSEETRLKFAKLCAEKKKADTAKYIRNFNITTEKDRFELAKLHILNSCARIFPVILRFEITNQKNLLKLIEMISKFMPWQLALNIQEFEIAEESDRIEVAKNLAGQRASAYAVVKNIKGFKITNQVALAKIAGLCAENTTGMSIKNFEIKDPQVRFELALKTVSPKYIDEYEIENEDQRFQIAKACTDKRTRETVKYLQNFKLTDPAKIFEILEICSQKDGLGTAGYLINAREMIDSDSYKQLIRNCAKQTGITARVIPELEIDDPLLMKEIALLCSEHYEIAACITNFVGLAESVRIYIARRCSDDFRARLPEYIHLFDIKEESIRVELALRWAEINAKLTAKHFDNFKITNPIAIRKIAKRCAKNANISPCEYIDNFRITDPDFLKLLAGLCLRNDPIEFVKHMNKFKLLEEPVRIEFAKQCAELVGKETSEKIDHFNIHDPTALFEIAKIAAKNAGYRILPLIKNYRIANQVKLLDILKIAFLHTKTKHITDFFKSGELYELLTTKYLNLIKLYLVQIHSFLAAQFNIKDEWHRYFHVLMKDTYSLFSEDSKGLLVDFLEKTKIFSTQNIEPILKELAGMDTLDLPSFKKEELFFAIITKGRLLGAIYTYLQVGIDDPATRQKIIHSDLIPQILTFPQPHVRWPLFHGLLPLYLRRFDPNDTVITQIDANMPTFGLNKTKSKFYVMELCKRLVLDGVDASLVETLLEWIFKYAQNFKDSYSGGILIQLLISLSGLESVEIKKTMIAKLLFEAYLARERDFQAKYTVVATLETKLEQLIPGTHQFQRAVKKIKECQTAYDKKHKTETQLWKGIQTLQTLMMMNKSHVALEKGTLEENLQKSFLGIIPIGAVDDFSTKFFDHFLMSRTPNVIIRYAASLARLEEQKAMHCLGSFVTSVLNGTFHTDRYDATTSTHIQTMETKFPEIWEKWKKKAHFTFDELGIVDDKDEETDFDYSTWLRDKIGMNHIPVEALNLRALKSFFNSTTPTEQLISRLETQSMESKTVRFQYLCLKLTTSQNKEVNKIYLNELQVLMEDTPLNFPDFIHDIDGILNPEKKPHKSNLCVVVTDHPIDLLNAGTEVSGSCQRVDGSHNQNRGLLGYLWNGWVLMLKVSDTVNGPIMARCMIRLLLSEDGPVLYRERLYPDSMSKVNKKALNAMAIWLAEELGVVLLSEDEGVEYGKPIQALGGRGRYEYVDGGRNGVKKKGIYTITTAKYKAAAV